MVVARLFKFIVVITNKQTIEICLVICPKLQLEKHLEDGLTF